MHIEKLVSQYTDLRPSGQNFKGKCPLHDDTMPSLWVYPKTESYYCFSGCGGGNYLKFVSEVNKCSKEQAKTIVKETLGDDFNFESVDANIAEASKERGDDDSHHITKELLEDFKSGAIDGKRKTYTANNYRGIKDKYHKFYGHLSQLGAEGNVIAQWYPETNKKGKVRGYKQRKHPKKFVKGFGEVGVKSQLSGQSRFKAGGKYVLIVGGEIDKVSAYQMLAESQENRNGKGYDPIPVVSPTSGENSAVSQCAAQYEWLDSFDIIVVGLDNDEAGRAAAEQVCKVLPKEKVKIATWSMKDPNEMLVNGKEKQFVRDFYSAKEYVASGIIASRDLLGKIKEELLTPSIPLPPWLSKLQENTKRGGFRQGSIINIIADTSVGKSLFVNSLVYYWIYNAPKKVGVISLEATAGKYGLDILGIHLQKNLTWAGDGESILKYLDRSDVQEMATDLWMNDVGDDRWVILDERDGSVPKLQKTIDRLISQHNCGIIIIDVLTDILRGSNDDQQEDFMMWEKRVIKSGVTIVNVLHTRKPTNVEGGGFRKATEYDAFGSSTFVQSAAYNIVLNRNKMSEDDIIRNTTVVDMPKCRDGVTGPAGNVFFDAPRMKLWDYDVYFRENEQTY